MKLVILFLLFFSFFPGNITEVSDDDYRELRNRLVDLTIERRGIDHSETLKAMRNVPRHNFVREAHISRAYEDSPIPIGFGQTISQPYIVAYMTQMINPQPGQRILEIGTGSGYQAAVLAEITKDVFSIEIVEELAEWGTSNLQKSGYDYVKTKYADGYYGWEEFAPFDAIVVTAAADHIPPPLIEQLKDGGKMIIPVGSPFQVQNLILVTKKGDEITTQSLLPVRFVPFTRGE